MPRKRGYQWNATLLSSDEEELHVQESSGSEWERISNESGKEEDEFVKFPEIDRSDFRLWRKQRLVCKLGVDDGPEARCHSMYPCGNRGTLPWPGEGAPIRHEKYKNSASAYCGSCVRNVSVWSGKWKMQSGNQPKRWIGCFGPWQGGSLGNPVCPSANLKAQQPEEVGETSQEVAKWEPVEDKSPRPESSKGERREESTMMKKRDVVRQRNSKGALGVRLDEVRGGQDRGRKKSRRSALGREEDDTETRNKSKRISCCSPFMCGGIAKWPLPSVRENFKVGGYLNMQREAPCIGEGNAEKGWFYCGMCHAEYLEAEMKKFASRTRDDGSFPIQGDRS